MKPLVKKHRRFGVRLRPGGLLLVRPPVLRRLGWTLRTDTIRYEWEVDRVMVYKKPTETEWRIERPRTRIDPQHPIPSPGYVPRTLAEFHAGSRPARKPFWKMDVLVRMALT